MNEEKVYLNIKIDDLVPSQHQPRKVFNKTSLEELAKSIKKFGILNPILVKKKEDKYEIISGERRLKASILAGLSEIPARVIDVPDDKIVELAMAENLQRENVSPIEEARSYEKIMQLNSIKEEDLSEIINKNQSIINNKLTLLKLPENVQQALNERKIGEKHARTLMKVEDDDTKTELLNRIINEKLTVKDLENVINNSEINEEEIENALNDITKALNIEFEEKEKKESDNMNNGNFFPNTEQTPTPTEPTSMQPTNPAPFENTAAISPSEIPANPIPEINPMPEVSVTPEPSLAPTPTPEVNPIPDFSTPSGNDTTTPLPQTDQPLFGNTENTISPPQESPAAPTPEINPLPESLPTEPIPEVPAAPVAEAAPVVDTPLFNTENTETTESPIPSFDVPVETPQENSAPSVDKVKELLNSNGIAYKAYSNETGHCIIIEI